MAISRSRGRTRYVAPADLDGARARLPRGPAMVRSRVDLPQPEGPTSTVNSPEGTSRSMPLHGVEGAVVLVEVR